MRHRFSTRRGERALKKSASLSLSLSGRRRKWGKIGFSGGAESRRRTDEEFVERDQKGGRGKKGRRKERGEDKEEKRARAARPRNLCLELTAVRRNRVDSWNTAAARIGRLRAPYRVARMRTPAYDIHQRRPATAVSMPLFIFLLFSSPRCPLPMSTEP